jgi:hypothetical protein
MGRFLISLCVLLVIIPVSSSAETNPDTALDYCLALDRNRGATMAGPVTFTGQQVMMAANGMEFITNPTEIEIHVPDGTYYFKDTARNEQELLQTLHTLIAGQYHAYGVVFANRMELVVAVGGESVICERFMIPLIEE